MSEARAVRRFLSDAEGEPWAVGDAPLVVGVSGGLDSMTLLYLLRFESPVPEARLHVAHLDHRMRPGSGADAEWLAGVCRAWALPIHVRAADPPVASEAEGRTARYGYFDELRQTLGASFVLTAHTADDQAETVLFRIARGAGPAGLSGIRRRLESGIARPLLDLWREDLERLCSVHRIPYREDPSNRDPRWVRNRLRHVVLPALEDAVPGARRSLARLARVSADERRALDALTDGLIDELGGEGEGGVVELDRRALLELPDAVLAQVVRRASSRLGARLGYQATADAVAFLRSAPSGRRLRVSADVALERHFDRVRIGSAGGAESRGRPGSPIVLEGPAGTGALQLPRRRVEVRWGSAPAGGYPHQARFPIRGETGTLTLRAWRSGDRLQTPYGKKKVKKVLAERRIPGPQRSGVPVLTDGRGTVLWVPGITDPWTPAPLHEGEHVWVCVRYSKEDEHSGCA